MEDRANNINQNNLLGAMTELYQEQGGNNAYQSMDFDDCFNFLVDYEYDRRKSNKLERLIKQATFNDLTAATEDIECHPDRNLDENLILELAIGNYIRNHLNIILMGASGNERKWISNAFGVHACRQLQKVKYIRLPELLDELPVAKYETDDSFRKLIQKYKKIDLFIVSFTTPTKC